METATARVIGQLAEYVRELTQRLDSGAGWYGEFLRRDPEGVRACVEGAAIPPWDVVESLLRDLAGVRGAEAAARETVYAGRLRAAAVAAWDRLPGGAEELRTLLAAAASQRADAERALRDLTARLGGAADHAEADALGRELSWTRDDAARAASRYEDLRARLAALPPEAAAPYGEPLAGVPRQREAAAAGAGALAPQAPANGVPAAGAQGAAARPVGRAEGRWLRGARTSGGARYAGAAAFAAPVFTPPPGHPDGGVAPAGPGPDGAPAPASGPSPQPGPPAPRGARFGRPAAAPRAPSPSPSATPSAPAAAYGPDGRVPAPGGPGPGPGTAQAEAPAPGRSTRALVGELLALRGQGRTGEAHALLCEAAAWPADRLSGLAAELGRAGLSADWSTLLWEAAASLPPERLAELADALGEAGREADRDRLLRQGVARPAAEIADAALALDAAGRGREAEALLGAFVRVRTAEEAAALARRAPQWFAPRLLRAAEGLSGTRRRDLVHALRVAGIAPV
ncbi:hypothetical protein [Streptomyces sp. H27-S2]|uniref:hypothetical protein n=1 Tax=Streptomyces antarcticus TaxID=2996458 RepID=UPI002271E137|nr:hypothetical protein [Streptomyces sp. H27-S2]MCY0950863.1 hypothetical protein [Streptomyces sp. H27-S2]